MEIKIYTDGACSRNPGIGGWAAIIEYENYCTTVSGYENNTTNNRMELVAAIGGLESLENPSKVRIFSDSQYVIRAFHDGWLKGWLRNNWHTSSGKPTQNRDLWERLHSLTTVHDVSWEWVKGHNGHIQNCKADSLAKIEIKILKAIKCKDIMYLLKMRPTYTVEHFLHLFEHSHYKYVEQVLPNLLEMTNFDQHKKSEQE